MNRKIEITPISTKNASNKLIFDLKYFFTPKTTILKATSQKMTRIRVESIIIRTRSSNICDIGNYNYEFVNNIINCDTYLISLHK